SLIGCGAGSPEIWLVGDLLCMSFFVVDPYLPL
ncbi:hypothetical protein A2U01_0107565, partial [Trifolium medium]|nr:hypothetical protein [Trifolium medium]